MTIGLPVGALLTPILGGAGAASAGAGAAGGSTTASPDFGAYLKSMAADTVGALKTGEAMSIAGMQGKASTQQVVEAVMQAEQSLHAAVAIRDKVVGAYLEISRMSI